MKSRKAMTWHWPMQIVLLATKRLDITRFVDLLGMFLFSFLYVDFDSNQIIEIDQLSIEIVYLMYFPRQANKLIE